MVCGWDIHMSTEFSDAASATLSSSFDKSVARLWRGNVLTALMPFVNPPNHARGVPDGSCDPGMDSTTAALAF
jgi:hypothetical protein